MNYLLQYLGTRSDVSLKVINVQNNFVALFKCVYLSLNRNGCVDFKDTEL